MFARVVNLQFQPGTTGEASRVVREAIVPAMQNIQGFRGQYLLVQEDSDRAVSINLWDTRDDLAAFESSPLYGELLGQLKGMLAAPPAAEMFSVSVQA